MNGSITYKAEKLPVKPVGTVATEAGAHARPPQVPASGVLVRVCKTDSPEDFPLGTVLLMYRAGKAHIVKHNDRAKIGTLVHLAPRRGEPPCPIAVEPIPEGEKVEVS